MKIVYALVKKEFLQIVRDSSTLIIAFILPLLMMLIFMYGINMDTPFIKIGMLNEDDSPELGGLLAGFSSSKYMSCSVYDARASLYMALEASEINAAIIIPNDFSDRLERGQAADLQLISDGSQVSAANYAQIYAGAAANEWLSRSKYGSQLRPSAVQCETRVWYNQDLNSHNFILPGSLAITLNLVGLLMTSLVVAREWERGTMEALLGTGVSAMQLVLGKYIPYYCLGMLSLCFSLGLCIFVFAVPFQGSLLIVLGVSSLFLLTAIGIGLFISTMLKNQFLACEVSLGAGFLPALLLSGLMFPISSMPYFFQLLTRLLPPRYYVTFIESEFLSGTIPQLVIANAIYLSGLSLLFFWLVYKNTSTRLESGGGRRQT